MKLYSIYQHLQIDFIRFASSLTHHREQAEDLVQQAYLKAMDQDELFEHLNEPQIKGWFFTTIRNQFIDDRRRNRRLVTFEPEHVGEYAVNFEDVAFVNQALDILPAQLKTIIEMRFISGYTSSEIAEHLSMNASTVRNKISQGIHLIRVTFLKGGSP